MAIPGTVRIARDTPLGEASACIRLVGGGIRELRFAGRDIIPLDSDLAYTRWFSGVVMAPWANRVRDGRWVLDGAERRLPVNDAAGHAIHGLVHDRSFDVVASDASSLTIECPAGGVDGYPFDVLLRVRYELEDVGLVVTMTAVNRSDRRAPVVLSAHPYFAYTAGATIELDAQAAFVIDDRKIPTGDMVDPREKGIAPGAAIPLSGLRIDDTFTSLGRDADGNAHTLLRHADGWVTDVWQGPGLTCTVVFTCPEHLWADNASSAVAIEPQTAPTDAFNSGTGLVWLAPAGELAIRWGVAVRGPAA